MTPQSNKAPKSTKIMKILDVQVGIDRYYIAGLSHYGRSALDKITITIGQLPIGLMDLFVT